MRSTFVFISALLMLVFVASSVDAKPNMGSDCASCHEDMATEPPVVEPPVVEPPVTEPPVTEPPVVEPPVTEPPVVEPPVTEPPVVEPPVNEPPVTEPPVVEPPVEEPAIVEPAAVLQGIEITTIWDYNIVDGQADLDYVFYTVIETDNTVNFVEIITPLGTVLQLTQEPETQLDNIITRFTDEGDIFVWQCEARFDDIEQLAAYGKGKFTIATVTDEAVTDTIIKFHPPKAKVKQPKHQKNKAHMDHGHFEDSDEHDGDANDDDHEVGVE